MQNNNNNNNNNIKIGLSKAIRAVLKTCPPTTATEGSASHREEKVLSPPP